MNLVKSSATFQLVVLTCIISVLGFFIPSFFHFLQLTPSSVVLDLSLWVLLTHIFLHGSFVHLFANMFSLWFIGSTTEKILGRKRFISIYILSGVIAGVLSATLAWFFGFGVLERIFGSPNIAMVGASGAIFGLAGVLAALIPRAKVYLLTGPLFAIILGGLIEYFVKNSIVSGIINIILTAYIFFSIFSMFSFNPRSRNWSLPLSIPLWVLPFVSIFPLMIIGMFVQLNIGNVAHLGGFLVGLIYGWILRNKYPQKTAMLQRYFR
jgi:membrane associated rhomboid family serine protease